MQSSRDSFAAFPEEYDVRNARQHSAAQQQATKQAQQASAIYEYNILRDGAPNYPTLVPTPVAPHPDYPSRHTSTSVNGRSKYQAPPDDVHLDEQAIEMRQQHHSAITYWGRRVKLCFALHLVTALCLLHSDYWFTTVIGVAMLIAIWLYAYAIKQRQTNFVLTYLVIVVVNLVKNIVLLYFYFVRNRSDGGTLDSYTWFLVAMMLQDAALLTPFSFYTCFYLHRSISLTHLTF